MKCSIFAGALLLLSSMAAAWVSKYTMTTKDRAEISITETQTGSVLCVDSSCANLTNDEAGNVALRLRPAPEPDPEFKRVLDEITKTARGCEENRFIEAGKRAVENTTRAIK